MVLQKHGNPKREIIASLATSMKVSTREPQAVSPEQVLSHRSETAEQARALGLVLVDEPAAELAVARAGVARKRVHPMG